MSIFTINKALKVILTLWLVVLLAPLLAIYVIHFIPWALSGFSTHSFSFGVAAYATYRASLWLIPLVFLAVLYYLTHPNQWTRYWS